METSIELKSADGRGEIAVMDRTGDTKFVWDSRNPAEVENARAQFDHWKKKGYLAHAVSRNGDKAEMILAFDPTLEKIIFSPPLVGG